METPKTFREHRKARGLTQLQLAEATGMNLKTIGRIEREEIPLYHDRYKEAEVINHSVARLLRFYDVTAEQIATTK